MLWRQSRQRVEAAPRQELQFYVEQSGKASLRRTWKERLVEGMAGAGHSLGKGVSDKGAIHAKARWGSVLSRFQTQRGSQRSWWLAGSKEGQGWWV